LHTDTSLIEYLIEHQQNSDIRAMLRVCFVSATRAGNDNDHKGI